ncbi:MAG TPA: vitamin K epoxide reductase family protein [Rubricoccaceae bacterium]
MALPPQTSTLRLLLVGAALLGFLVVTHLGLQASNDFANGCSGIAGAPVAYDPTAPTETSGCEEVTSSVYSTFLGVSQIAWGLLFYGLLAALRLAYVATADDRVRLASFALSAVGVLYAAYLVYLQVAEIGAFCALCLTSSTLVLVLFVLHFLEHRRLRSGAAGAPRRAASPDRRGLAALRPYAPILGLFAVLMGADVALANRSDADAPAVPPRQLTTNGVPTAQIGAPAGPVGDVAASCQFDPNVAPIADLSQFTTGPFKGSSDEGAVPVIEIFDPNCPHCRDLAEVLGPIVEAESGRARFYYVAYPLRQESIGQVIALKEAQREGKYFELIDEMFRRLDQSWGMSIPELVASLDAVGMDGAAFQAMLQDEARLQPLLTQVQADAAAVGAAFASADGGISTPRVAVGNRVILATPQAFTPDCFAEFISQAAAQ